jgi:hypothetical protein
MHYEQLHVSYVPRYPCPWVKHAPQQNSNKLIPPWTVVEMDIQKCRYILRMEAMFLPSFYRQQVPEDHHTCYTELPHMPRPKGICHLLDCIVSQQTAVSKSVLSKYEHRIVLHGKILNKLHIHLTFKSLYGEISDSHGGEYGLDCLLSFGMLRCVVSQKLTDVSQNLRYYHYLKSGRISTRLQVQHTRSHIQTALCILHYVLCTHITYRNSIYGIS